MNCKEKSNSQPKIKKDISKFQYFISRDRLDVIYNATEIVAGNNKIKFTDDKAFIDALIFDTSDLDLILNHARDHIRGDYEARYRLIDLLNHIIQREGVQIGSKSVSMPKSSEKHSGEYKSADFESMFTDRIIPSRKRSKIPCFLDPFVIRDIFWAIIEIIWEEEPKISLEIFKAYLNAIGRLIERHTTKLGLLYDVAVKLSNYEDTKALNYFDTTLNLIRNSRISEISTDMGLFEFIFGNPDLIPRMNNPKRLLTPCDVEIWEATAAAFRHTRDLIECRSYKYKIEKIKNLSKSTPDNEILGRGCPTRRDRLTGEIINGDTIEIIGEHFDAGRRGAVIFPTTGFANLTEAEDVIIYENNRIQCIIPPDVKAGAITLHIPCPGYHPALPSQYRLSAVDNNPWFDIIQPPEILDFSVIGQVEPYTINACQPFTLHVRANNIESLIIKDQVGTEIFAENGDVRNFNRDIPTIRNLRNNEIYTLIVKNLCCSQGISKTLTVNVTRRIEVIPDLRDVTLPTNSSFQMRIGVASCLLQGEDELQVNISIDPAGQDNVRIVTNALTLTSDQFSQEVDVTTLSPGAANITISANGFDDVNLSWSIVPVIDSIAPASQYLNEEIIIKGKGFIISDLVSLSVRYPCGDNPPKDITIEQSQLYDGGKEIHLNIPNDASSGNLYVVLIENNRLFQSEGFPFNILPPYLERLDPPAAYRGENVSIWGKGFSTINQDNKVKYIDEESGPTDSGVISSTPHMLGWRIPGGSGAISGDVSVGSGYAGWSGGGQIWILRQQGIFREVFPRLDVNSFNEDGTYEIIDCQSKKYVVQKIQDRNVKDCYPESSQVTYPIPQYKIKFFQHIPASSRWQQIGDHDIVRHPQQNQIGGVAFSPLCLVGVIVDGMDLRCIPHIFLINSKNMEQIFESSSRVWVILRDPNDPRRERAGRVNMRFFFSTDDSIAMIIDNSMDDKEEYMRIRFIDCWKYYNNGNLLYRGTPISMSEHRPSSRVSVEIRNYPDRDNILRSWIILTVDGTEQNHILIP